MTHLFIVNPAAGKRDRTEEIRAEVRRVCEPRGLPYEIAVSAAPGDCTRIAREAAQSGAPCRIYACGGDGTLNEVVNGAAGCPNVAVTHYAAGSGNDFVKIFGAVEPFRDLEALIDGETAEFDLIRCNDDYVLNICSVGLDARIGTQIAAYKRLPLVSGPMAYILSTVTNVIRGIGEHFVVELGDEIVDGLKTMICVCNGRYYGGGFNPVPEADPCDGLLDVLLVEKVSRLKVAGVVGAYKAGRYRELPEIVRHVRTDKLTIRCDKPTAINLDGELRRSANIHIRVAAEKLRFFYPRGLSWGISE